MVNCLWTDVLKEVIELRLQPSGESVIEKKVAAFILGPW